MTDTPAIAALKSALATQPQGEPVAAIAWVDESGAIIRWPTSTNGMRPLVYGDTSPPPARKPLTDEQIEKGREDTFSTNNPFCPCDSKTMRKAVRWAERAHRIGEGA